MNNLHIDQLLDLAYEIAQESFKDKQFTFSMIWSKTWKSAQGFKKEPVEDWIGIFYTSLQLDTRFVKCPNNHIVLKEFINYTEYKKYDKNIYSDDACLEEDFEKEKSSPVSAEKAPSRTSSPRGPKPKNKPTLKTKPQDMVTINTAYEETGDKEVLENLIDSEI